MISHFEWKSSSCPTFLSLRLKKRRSIKLASLPNKVMFMARCWSSHCYPWESNKLTSCFLISSRLSDNGLFQSFSHSPAPLTPRPAFSLSCIPHLPLCRCHSFCTLPLPPSSMTQHPLIFQISISVAHFSFLFPLPCCFSCHFLLCSFSPLTKHSYSCWIFFLLCQIFTSLIYIFHIFTHH